MKINLYDFDGTIYDGDSSIEFYKFCLKRKFSIIVYLPNFIIYMFLYKIGIKTKEQMKSKYFAFVKKFDNIDKVVNDFWSVNRKKIKQFYLVKRHSNDIIISASPYFLLKPIADVLQVKDLIASDVDKKTGKFISKNCHGVEKVNILNSKYDNYIVEEAYSDSLSDIPILKLAKKAYLVKKDEIIKWDDENEK